MQKRQTHYQQFKKAVLVHGQQRLWVIATLTQAGNIREYTGIASC